jgi:hypothetical protein
MSARESVHLTDAQLDDYAEAAMSDAERSIAEQHLAGCARCRHAVDETRTVLEWATRERVAVTAPAELWPLVASSTIHLAAMRRRVLASMRGMLVIGAITLIAATALVTWKLARWTATPDEVTAPAAGPGRHVGHPKVPIPPKPPEPPRPPRRTAP